MSGQRVLIIYYQVKHVRVQMLEENPWQVKRRPPKEWGWQYVFPSRQLSTDPLSGVTWRHHIDRTVVNRAIKGAARRAGQNSSVAQIYLAFCFLHVETQIYDKGAVFVSFREHRWPVTC
jgi:hypothetical protein